MQVQQKVNWTETTSWKKKKKTLQRLHGDILHLSFNDQRNFMDSQMLVFKQLFDLI